MSEATICKGVLSGLSALALAGCAAFGAAAALPQDAQAVLATPGRVSIASVEVKAHTVKVTLNKVANATGYSVYLNRGTKPDMSGSDWTGSSWAEDGSTYVFSGLVDGETYCIYAQAVNRPENHYQSTEGPMSKPVVVTTKVATHRISYKLAGGTLPQDAPRKFTRNSATFSLPTPTREGYVFKGWATTIRRTDGFRYFPYTATIKQVRKGTAQDFLLTAKWQKA